MNLHRKKIYFVFFFSIFILTSCAEVVTGVPSVRKPAVAGSFYPADKKELSLTLEKYLDMVSSEDKENEEIWGIIAPHAGYTYSASVAAHAYKKIKGKPYKTVIILASSHYMKYSGIAIYPDGAWETPLGRINVDTSLAKELQGRTRVLKTFATPFIPEHSIEAQLPFLQKTLENFKIVPILFGQEITDEEYSSLANELLNLVKSRLGEILIVASTDLSHYHEYSRAKIMDNIALKNIKDLELEKLETNLQQRNCEMCGASAVITLMRIAEKFPTEIRILKYANSGDTVGEKNSVVGYASVAFYISKNALFLNTSEQKTLLKLARKTLNKYVLNREIPDYDAVDERLKEKSGVFITLKKNNELRGCIGSLTPEKSLIDGVIEMTIAAATRDVRFPRVTPNELSDINIEISIIGQLKKIEKIEEIEVGKHGLYLCSGLRCGVLLPQVAVENKWDREEFLKMVSLKAGLPPSAWKDSNTNIYTFTAQVFSE